jgi:hypothetical protein
MVKIGDKYRFIYKGRDYDDYCTLGRVYTITDLSTYGVCFKGDDGSNQTWNSAIFPGTKRYAESTEDKKDDYWERAQTLPRRKLPEWF